MKKKAKKLVLAKETVRQLEGDRLVKAVGGEETQCQTCDSCGARFCYPVDITTSCW
jgi:hypothetical protein